MARKAAVGAGVVAIKRTQVLAPPFLLQALYLVTALLLYVPYSIYAAVLPDERLDVSYQSYEGGGLDIKAPAILVRKAASRNLSLQAHYYIDQVSGASIDVITTASAYDETRKESHLSADYLFEKSILSTGITHSQENDFKAQSLYFNSSQDFFGDLTTLTLGYARGWDEISKTGDASFFQEADRHHYRLGVSQILSKHWLVNLDMEFITDEGFLNNAYRSVRFLDSTVARGFSYEAERYPNTRNSNALALTSRYYLPYRAAFKVYYRYFSDSWDIDAHTFELAYVHPLKAHWVYELRLRYYQQTQAEFYSDLFPRANAQNFLARDKELSQFNDQSFGFSISYLFNPSWLDVFKQSKVTLAYDRVRFDYDNFRDLQVVASPGTEPLYAFEADVIRLYLSFKF